jgi:hypothetical protein
LVRKTIHVVSAIVPVRLAMRWFVSDNMTPIINVIQSSHQALDRYYSDLTTDIKAKIENPPTLKTVELHKQKLGKQTTTWVGFGRFYVWIYPNWRIFVKNGHGVSFEVKDDLTPEEAMVAWNEYRAMMSRDTTDETR